MVVDYLRVKSKHENVGVACVYLNHKEAEDQTPSRLLAGLWRQLVLDRDVGSLARQLYRWHYDKCTRASLEEVIDLLHSSFAEFSTVYIVVDAIDEYPEGQRWILLQRLAAMDPTVNLMITSRPHVTPDASLPNLDTLEIRASDDDVRRYVDSQIQRSPRLSKHVQARPELREEIHSKMSRTVDGMYVLSFISKWTAGVIFSKVSACQATHRISDHEEHHQGGSRRAERFAGGLKRQLQCCNEHNRNTEQGRQEYCSQNSYLGC